MVGCRMNWYTISDFIWPSLEAQEPDKEFKQELQKPTGTWAATSPEAHAEVAALIAAEEDRLRTVDTKLQALLSMAPIAATLIVALVTFVTKEPQAYKIGSVGLVVLSGAHVILQLLRTVLAAIAGLGVQIFQRVALEELTPQADETADAYRTRVLETRIKCFLYNQSVTDGKVSQLKVAYRAIENALGMLLLLVVILGIIAISNYQH